MALKETLGPDVGVETTETQIKFMKAYDRYSRNLYSKISKSACSCEVVVNSPGGKPEILACYPACLYLPNAVLEATKPNCQQTS